MDVINQIDDLSIRIDRPFQTPARVQHICLAGPAPFPRPRELLLTRADLVSPWLVDHHACKVSTPAPALNLYCIENLGLVGHDITHLDGRPILAPQMLPAYRARQLVEHEAMQFRQRLRLPSVIVDEPCFPLAADGNVYGHFLTETLARLHIVRNVMRHELPRLKVCIIGSLPGWLRRILLVDFGIAAADLVEYDPMAQQVLLRRAIWPSLPIFVDQFHPFMNQVAAELLASCPRAGLDPIRRVLVTRVLFGNPAMAQRSFENELEIAAIAVQDYGFTALAPETLPWQEQLRLFAGAHVLAGRYGSALHNALFAARDVAVGVFGFNNLVQSGIGALRSQRLAYVTHGSDREPYLLAPDHARALFDAITG